MRFQLDHCAGFLAMRVYAELDPRWDLVQAGAAWAIVRSAASDPPEQYLRRPDLGRVLSDDSQGPVGGYAASTMPQSWMADGLFRAPALHYRHAKPLLDALIPLLLAQEEWRMAPLTVVPCTGARRLATRSAKRLGAKLVVLLIGERPGLTAPDSLGIYLTYNPRPGRTEAERNCISNVRPEGLPYRLAARKLHFLMRESRLRKLTGVSLKEDAARLLE